MKHEHARILSRSRLNEKLEDILQYPLTVVTAPMGFGKTTAVRSFIDERTLPHIWLTMTESVKIAASEYFWFLLEKGVRAKAPRLAQALRESGFPCDSVQISRMIDTLEQNSSLPETVVIIDDYYLIENSEINALMKRLVYAQIPWLHIVIISRKVPAIGVDELIVKGFCHTIDTGDLSFTEEELESYLDMVSFHGSEESRQKIRSYAGGWITAIYLMTLGLSQNKNLEFYRSINAMLKSSFFDRYPPEIKDFLFRLSFFDMLTADQAVYFFDDPVAAQRLERLYEDNAFITLDREGRYRFHQIFLDFLREERKGCSLDTRSLMQRAGEWYSMQEDHALAFKYWMAAGNYEAILDELEKTDIRNINSIDRKLIFQVFSNVRDEQKYKYPIATLRYIWLVICFIDKDRGAQMLNRMEAYFMQHEHKTYSRNQILAEIAMVSTTLAFNDAEQFISCTKKALQLLNGKTTIIRNRKSVLPYGVPHFTYDYYRTPGEYRKTVDILVNGFKSHIEATGGCGMGCINLARAEYGLETGAFENVELAAQKAIYKARMREQSTVEAGAYMTLARLYLYQNRNGELWQVLDHIDEMAHAERDTIVLNTLDNCRGYINACMGRLEAIPKWLRQGDMTVYTSQYQGSAFNYIIYGKSILLSEDYIKLEVMTEAFEEYFAAFHNQLGYIPNYIHSAVAKYHIYGMFEGAKTLQKAFDIAQQDGVVMPFAENAEFILPMLKSKLLEADKTFMKKVLQLCEKNTDTGSTSILSPRELEVIILMEAGKSQKEIADSLCISPNTVKRHVQNIYQKLDTNNKTLAIKRFRTACSSQPAEKNPSDF